jgi:GAF domain-containing protein
MRSTNGWLIVRIRLKGINVVRKRLADGSVRAYHYAWKGGPALRGEPGTPEFIASYNEAAARKVTPPRGTLLSVLNAYQGSEDFRGLAGSTRPSDRGFYFATNYNFPADWLEFTKNIVMTAGRGSVVGRTLLDGKITHVEDVMSDPDYTFREEQRKGGYRTFLGVPLLREGQPIGVLTLGRKKVNRFTEKQIDLVMTFGSARSLPQQIAQ